MILRLNSLGLGSVVVPSRLLRRLSTVAYATISKGIS